MSRKDKDFTRDILPDPKYGDFSVAKFINCMMKNGKHLTSEKIFYGALKQIQERYNENGFQVFQKALENVKPLLEVRSRRVGGANYQIPTEVRPERQRTLAIRWLIQSAKTRSEKTMLERLTNELYDASKKRGSAFKKKEDTHRMAEANRAFAHYRW